MASSSLGASSSVPPAPQWTYDVFLSFRGETRKNFTAHLLKELKDQGITTIFFDEDEIEKGQKVSVIFQAIKQSSFAIIVISPDFASSKWCMNELVKILECLEEKHAVLPIFYSVEPTHVGNRLENFGPAFTKLEQEFKKEEEMVKGWKAALETVAKIKGWPSKDRYEPNLIKDIVEDLRRKIRPILLEPAGKLIGMDSNLKKLDLLLNTDPHDVRFIGIWGMGGIGKTTIARKAYERNLHKFEANSFLDGVREHSNSKAHGLPYLKRLLSTNVMKRKIEDWNIHEEQRMRNFLLHKKVLLILDDVDHIVQLQELCGDRKWFGPGSRVIISTRDEHLLITHGAERMKVKGLNFNGALKLFSLRAFNTDYPPESYIDLSTRFVYYAGGLPLALAVLGTLLHGKDEDAWSSHLLKLEGNNLNAEIMDILKISYNALDKQQKDIFLDIACFFKGMSKVRVSEILESCGFHPNFDIDVLIKRSLISISDNIVWMHDLLQEMGRAIVHQQSQEPGEQSRLWLSEDIFHVLMNKTGTAEVQGIVLDLLESKEAKCDPEAFLKMCKLRLLRVHNLDLPQGLNSLPNSLRFLEWRGCPLESLPPGFESDKLVELSMCHSSIKQLWTGNKNFDKLKVMKVSHSKNLRRTPDFKGVQNLEKLDLEGCEGLDDIRSIGVLQNLTLLNLKDCKNLESLPDKIEMEYLEMLILSGCPKVKKIPEFGRCMENLQELSLDGTAIESMPSSIEHLTNLSSLDLRDCINLKGLPSTIGNMKSLKLVNVSGCSNLAKLPESFGKLECLEKFDFSGTAITVRSSSSVLSLILPPLSGLCSLRELDLRDANLWEGALPHDIGCLSSLVSLNLSGNNFLTLPTSLGQLSKLENLYLSRCRRLQHLPVLSSDVKLEVTADDCTSLEMLQYPSNLDRLNCSWFNFINCSRLIDIESSNHITFSMLERYLKRIPYPGDRYEIVIPGSEIPQWLSHQRKGGLVTLKLTPEWHNNKWMGYALCAVFQVSGSGWELSCVLEVNGKEEYPAPLLSTNVQPVSDHIWLFYVSRHISFGTEWQNTCNQLTFSFKSSGPCLIKKCGVRLVYEQDVEEVSKVVTQSTTTTSIFRYEATNADQYDDEQGFKRRCLGAP